MAVDLCLLSLSRYKPFPMLAIAVAAIELLAVPEIFHCPSGHCLFHTFAAHASSLPIVSCQVQDISYSTRTVMAPTATLTVFFLFQGSYSAAVTSLTRAVDNFALCAPFLRSGGTLIANGLAVVVAHCQCCLC